MTKSVGVSGISVLTASGIGNEDVWQSVLNQKNAQCFREYNAKEGVQLRYPVYPINMKQLIRDSLEPKTIGWLKDEGLYTDYDFILLLVAAKSAIVDAGLPKEEARSISLVIAHENLGVNQLIDKVLAPDNSTTGNSPVLQNPMKKFKEYQDDFFHLQTFPHLFNLSKALKIEGLTYTVNNACASGLYALELGKMMIQTQQTDIVLVVASDYAHVSEYLWLKSKGFVSKANKLKPFDKRRDGSILGDGAAAIILESSNFIKKYNRSDKIKCSFWGGSFKQDTWRMTVPDVSKNSYSKVIKNAMKRSGLSQVDLLIPHGAGIPMWDYHESKEINKAFEEIKLPAVTAFKGYFGHTLGANALIESVVLINCLNANLIPQTMNYEIKDDKVRLPVVQQETEKELKIGMKTVSAYGGFHAAVVFQKLDKDV